MVERASKPASIPITPTAPAPLVSVSDDGSRVVATIPAGDRVEILLHGATVISWKTADGKENLFLSEKALLDGSKPVRGGIPLVFPSFGPPQTSHETGKLPQHGFARNVRWELLGKSTEESSRDPKTAGDASVKMDFGLSDAMLDDATKAKWPHAFGLTYSVAISPGELQTSMLVRNTGQESWEFNVLLHTYLACNDIEKTEITGLESTPFINKVPSISNQPAANTPIKFTQETDRVYSDIKERVTTVVESGKPTLEVKRDEGLTDVVVWNPWPEKAGGMSDFAPKDGWKKMVCVEAGKVGNWVKVEGGESWEGGQRIRRVD